jgi:hypothetical protein
MAARHETDDGWRAGIANRHHLGTLIGFAPQAATRNLVFPDALGFTRFSSDYH